MSNPESSPPPIPSEPLSPAPGFSVVRVVVIVVILGGIAAAIGFGWAYGVGDMLAGFSTPTLAPVTGRVEYQGKPLTTGYVQSESYGKSQAVGALDEQGRFTLTTDGKPGAFVGTHRVAVMAFGRGMPPPPVVPEKYLSAKTSGLTMRVTASSPNEWVIVLEGDMPERSRQGPPAGGGPPGGGRPAAGRPQ